jgi:hypothetical protein
LSKKIIFYSRPLKQQFQGAPNFNRVARFVKRQTHNRKGGTKIQSFFFPMNENKKTRLNGEYGLMAKL